MPANAICGVMLLVVLLAALAWLPAIVLLVVLALPVAGMFRMAALIERGDAVALSDFVQAMRRFARPALILGGASTVAGLVFTANVIIGLTEGGLSGGIFAMLALYADIGLAMYLLAAWPLVVDPLRETEALSRRLRLAFYVVVTRAGRMLGLTLLIGVILAVSTVLFAALLTISVAFVCLVATRYVLPAADRLEGRPTLPIPS